MKKLLSFSFSKIYIIVMILISLLVVGGYFSYAMFTVSKERSNAISIVTGNLIYDLIVDGEDIEKLTVPAGTTKVFTVVLSNPNNRIARFNFYYLGTLPDGVSTGYSLLSDGMVTPIEAIKITMNDAKGLTGDVEYRVHVQSDGWKSYVKNDEIGGTTGQNKGIEAIQIRLTGELAEQYDIYYNVYIIGTGWQGYKKNDEVAGTTGASKRIEAIKIKLVEKS